MNEEQSFHIPVLCEEIIEALALGGDSAFLYKKTKNMHEHNEKTPKNQTQEENQSAIFIDATFGAGGYTRAILDAFPRARVLGMDRDSWALSQAWENFGSSALQNGQLTLYHGCFGDMQTLLMGAPYTPDTTNPIHAPAHPYEGTITGIVFDIGVSSAQLDQAERGFSFRFDGALDMRMDTKNQSLRAWDIVNTWSEEDLTFLLKTYGEERHARKIARALITHRTHTSIDTTHALAHIIRGVLHKTSAKDPIDPATRSFQALRICVNDELGELERGLHCAERLLRAGGCLAVVSFHSLEDRIVKSFMHSRSGQAPALSRHLPQATQAPPAPSFILPQRKTIKPSAQEIARNPRARSARLRVAIRTHAPAWAQYPTTYASHTFSSAPSFEKRHPSLKQGHRT